MVDARAGSAMARNTLVFLRQKIVSGEWPINSRIPTEPELMALLGVGKSTVREAVRSLASLGMLETIRGIGTFVRSRVPSDAVLVSLMSERGPAECLQLRAAVEGEAARALATRSPSFASPRLHGATRRASDCPANSIRVLWKRGAKRFRYPCTRQ